MSGETGEGTPRNREQGQRDGASPAQSIILVVDDDRGMRNLLREALSLHGYRVITTASVQGAEAALRRLGAAAIGLVIADVHLTADPRVQEGYALYERWTTAHPTLPFLLISGDPSSRNLPAIRTGAVPFLAKPFAISSLLAAVRTILGP